MTQESKNVQISVDFFFEMLDGLNFGLVFYDALFGFFFFKIRKFKNFLKKILKFS
jgi:hypothetical protein